MTYNVLSGTLSLYTTTTSICLGEGFWAPTFAADRAAGFM